MSTLNFLGMILSQKPIDGNDYEKWKSDHCIIFEFKRIKYVVTTPKSQEPTTAASQEIKMRYENWQWANTTVRCYILPGIASYLQWQITNLEDASEMIKILNRMFAKSSSIARQAAIKALMYYRITGGSVRDHYLMMMGYFSRAKVIGAKLDEDVQIDMILESLPNSFNQFKLNYNMHNIKLSPIDLIHQLESAEKTLVKSTSAYHAESSSKPNGQSKGEKQNKKHKGAIPFAKLAT
nr:uncharacterized protein LOC125423763 [Ziziphus jujuba var. spinosa]